MTVQNRVVRFLRGDLICCIYHLILLACVLFYVISLSQHAKSVNIRLIDMLCHHFVTNVSYRDEIKSQLKIQSLIETFKILGLNRHNHHTLRTKFVP